MIGVQSGIKEWITGAEIIRQATEREVTGAAVLPARSDRSAMEDFTLLAGSKWAQGKNAQPSRWNRVEIYAERESCWFRNRGEEK